MTTNKPEVKRYDCTSGGAQYCYGCYTMEEDEMGDYVEWEAYEALQAECEELRKDVAHLVEALECMIIGACAVAVPHNGERAVLQDAVNIARAALAAYRKQRGGE